MKGIYMLGHTQKSDSFFYIHVYASPFDALYCGQSSRRARLPVSYLLLLWVWNGKWEEVWGKVWIILTSSLYVQYMYIYTAAVAPPSGSNSESHLVASNCHIPPEFTQLILQHDFGLATVQYSVFRLRFKLFFNIFFMCVRWKGWLFSLGNLKKMKHLTINLYFLFAVHSYNVHIHVEEQKKIQSKSTFLLRTLNQVTLYATKNLTTLIENYIEISMIYYWCIGVKIIYHLNFRENISTNCHWFLSRISVKINFNELSLIFSCVFSALKHNSHLFFIDISMIIYGNNGWRFNQSISRF